MATFLPGRNGTLAVFLAPVVLMVLMVLMAILHLGRRDGAVIVPVAVSMMGATGREHRWCRHYHYQCKYYAE